MNKQLNLFLQNTASKFLFFIILLLCNYACDKTQDNTSNDLNFKTLKGQDCKDCEGYLVITKGKQSDTIKGGQWGKVVNYNTFKIQGKKYLFTNFTYSYQMGTKLNEYKIYSLEKKQYLKKLFEKAIVVYEEKNMKEKNVSINYTMERDVQVTLKDSIGFLVKMKIKKCPELENVSCHEIFDDTNLEYYTY
jgi:hypothetical protein